MEERYGQGPFSGECVVLVPLPVRAREEFGFLHIVWSTDFDSDLAYVAFRHVGEREWNPLSSWVTCSFSRIIGVGRQSATGLAKRVV